MSLKIRDVMVKDVVTVDSDYTVKNAANIMNRFSIGCVVVLEKEKVVELLPSVIC